MHQPAMPAPPVGSGEPDPSSWMKEVRLRIHQDFPRFDSIGTSSNTDDPPSIFNPRRLKPNHHVAVGVPMLAPTGAAASSNMIAAVGPYHGPSDGSFITDAKKKYAMVKFLADQQGSGLDIEDFLRWAQGEAHQVMRCYERDSFTMTPEKLAEMLLLDGCLLLFAVFLLRPSVHSEGKGKHPPGLTHDQVELFNQLSTDMRLHMKQTKLDLLMLSNQIPFFVLAELHRRLKGSFFKGIEASIQELALSCFHDIHPPPTRSGLINIKQDEFPAPVHHLLHLFHWSRVPQGCHLLELDDSCSMSMHAEPESHLPCATWFEECQTSFSEHAAPHSSSSRSSLHIVFQRKMLGVRGVMHVPAQHIHEYSESVFRSLIAFEQNHRRCGLAVTAYSICMARLLQTDADAKLLRERGILAHTHKTDKEIVDLFTGLADEYSNTFYSTDLLGLCKDVAAHHKSAAARAVKWVGLQCFPRQSVTFFVIFGALISVATVINTGYSVYRFYHPVK